MLSEVVLRDLFLKSFFTQRRLILLSLLWELRLGRE